MKRKNLIIVSLGMMLCFAQNTSAQKGFYIGVNGAPQTNWMFNNDDSDSPDFKYKPTFSAAFGGTVGYNFNSHLGLGVDVMYSMQGQKYELLGVELNQRNDYLKIPLFLSFNTNPEKVLMFQGKFGPQIGILQKSRLLDDDKNEIIGNNKDAFEEFNFGAILEIGLAINLSEHFQLTTGLRFDFAFTNAENEKYEFYQVDRSTTFNAVGGLNIGLKYNF